MDHIQILRIFALFPVSESDRSVDISGRESIWIVEDRNDGEQNSSDALSWIPSFAGKLAALDVVDRGMQD